MKISSATWCQHLKNFAASGLSMSEYCRREGINTHQLAYRLRRASATKISLPAAPPGFARITTLPTEKAVSEERGSAMAIFFATSVQPEWAAKLLSTIAKEMK